MHFTFASILTSATALMAGLATGAALPAEGSSLVQRQTNLNLEVCILGSACQTVAASDLRKFCPNLIALFSVVARHPTLRKWLTEAADPCNSHHYWSRAILTS
jgi:hypothetical protein